MRNVIRLEDKQRWMRERQAATSIEPPAPFEGRPFEDKHYSPAELGLLWGLGADAVRKLFEDELGVVILGRRAPDTGKRPYRTIRIPASVAERVHRRLQNR
jgi:hypothetical protein